MTNLAAVRVGRNLIAIEGEIDNMLRSLALLNADMTNASMDLELPGFLGQRALIKASDAHRKVLEARQDLIRTHEELRKISKESGDLWSGDCPQSGIEGNLAA